MFKLHKKLIICLLVLAIITPIGFLLPHFFKAGDAWGEWSINKIKEKIGFVPEGMQKNEKLWKAPISDYGLGDENSSLAKKTGNYVLSGIIGITAISLISFGLYKIMKKE